MKIKIDILLATYNGEKYIAEQIDSIMNQTYKDWNLIIRDDGSTDNTTKIIEEYKRLYPSKITLLKNNDKNLGASMNFSKLVEYSNADYIMFCDQDDIWQSDKIKTTFNEMKRLENSQNNKIPLMVFSDLTIVDENLNIIAKSFWNSQKLDPIISQSLYKILAQNVVTGCTIMINKKAAKQFFPIPTKYILHDHWVAINICKFGKASYIDRSLIYYRQHSNNELGAINIGYKYFYKQILYVFNNISKYKEKYTCFPFKINYIRLFWNKIYLNFKRL